MNSVLRIGFISFVLVLAKAGAPPIEYLAGDALPPAQYFTGPQAQLNELLRPPCFQHRRGYCMEPTGTQTGYCCSGQSASVVAFLQSMGIKASPYYLEWTTGTPAREEAHAMVAVPFERDCSDGRNRFLCLSYYIIEAAGTNPPVVEFTVNLNNRYVPGQPSVTVDQREILNQVRAHFASPRTAEQRQREEPARNQPLPVRTAKRVTDGRLVNMLYDTRDPLNAPTPVFRPEMQCNTDRRPHEVAPFITINQSAVTDRRDAGRNTKFVVDYPEWDCRKSCPSCTAGADTLFLGRPPIAAPRAMCEAQIHYQTKGWCKTTCESRGGRYTEPETRNQIQCNMRGTTTRISFSSPPVHSNEEVSTSRGGERPQSR